MDHSTFSLTTSKPYYRRHRVLPIMVGRDDSGNALTIPNIDAIVSRWGWQTSRYRRPHDAYLTEDGIWVYIANMPMRIVEYQGETYPDDYQHVYVPISNRRLTDRHPAYTLASKDVPPKTILRIGSQGILEAAVYDGIVIADDSMPVEQMRRVLGMAPAKRGRKPKAA